MKTYWLGLVLLVAFLDFSFASYAEKKMMSPNKKIILKYVESDNAQPAFVVSYADKHKKHDVVTLSSVGMQTKDGEGMGLKLTKIGDKRMIHENYEMLTGKRKLCTNDAAEYCFYFIDNKNKSQKIVFRLYDDGLAFRYELEDLTQSVITDELTTYCIPEGTKRWMQRYDMSYEGFFPKTTTGEGKNHHWGYPALLQTEDVFVLISEANIERGHAASSLKNETSISNYKVCPERNEKVVTGNWQSPWRVLIMGSLSDVVESTLVTDVSNPSQMKDLDWIQPGSVSWVYWAYNRGSKDFQIVKQYIDMGKQLKLPYMLIDWEWDVMGNGGTIDDALQYAKDCDVRTLLWYNSSTAWTTNGAGGPLFKLNALENREKEFAWLEQKGVAGVKIDFFSGDLPETMDYCLDLLECAARHHLLVNFHGATIPRGWQRTYPNLMSVEAVYGAEWYNNAPILTKRAAAHNATLPFTRNVIGPMDYTPCTFSDSQHPHITTNAHELALTVVFESALQHLADKPESYLAQPDAVKNFLTQLPTTWENTKLISGYPGESVVIARQKGETWYIGALNGLDTSQTLSLDWSFLKKGNYQVTWYKDSDKEDKSWKIESQDVLFKELPKTITCLPRGGFVAKITKKE